MNHESPIDDEYEPTDIDPDAPIATMAAGILDPPVEADPADWADQHRIVSEEDDDDER